MAVKPVTHLQGGRHPENGDRKYLPNISTVLSDHAESQPTTQNLSQIIMMPCSQLSPPKTVSKRS
jgi:hypothetical protein